MLDISMGTWVKLDGGPIRYSICEDEALFQLPNKSGQFELVATQSALEDLISNATKALTDIRAGIRNEE